LARWTAQPCSCPAHSALPLKQLQPISSQPLCEWSECVKGNSVLKERCTMQLTCNADEGMMCQGYRSTAQLSNLSAIGQAVCRHTASPRLRQAIVQHLTVNYYNQRGNVQRLEQSSTCVGARCLYLCGTRSSVRLYAGLPPSGSGSPG
jgi:hypothetical protein